jgi:hypothetical protein
MMIWHTTPNGITAAGILLAFVAAALLVIEPEENPLAVVA